MLSLYKFIPVVNNSVIDCEVLLQWNLTAVKLLEKL